MWMPFEKIYISRGDAEKRQKNIFHAKTLRKERRNKDRIKDTKISEQ
jgi:hypothetical protein